MIDIHAHILPLIDDGARSEIESLHLLKQAKDSGVTAIILTPHYIVGSKYNLNNEKKEALLAKLKNKAKQLNIELYIGNEIYFDKDIIKFIKKGEMASLNHSKYLLFELPMHKKVSNLFDVIFDLKVKGYFPILAHPERYEFLQKDPMLAEKLLEAGVFFQSNIGSLTGTYGKEAKKTLKLFLKHHMISFMASDIHHEENNFYFNLPSLYVELQKWLDDQYLQEIFNENAKNIIKNKSLEQPMFTPLKKGLFGVK